MDAVINLHSQSAALLACKPEHFLPEASSIALAALKLVAIVMIQTPTQRVRTRRRCA
jgi:hypothetical protein